MNLLRLDGNINFYPLALIVDQYKIINSDQTIISVYWFDRLYFGIPTLEEEELGVLPRQEMCILIPVSFFLNRQPCLIIPETHLLQRRMVVVDGMVAPVA